MTLFQWLALRMRTNKDRRRKNHQIVQWKRIGISLIDRTEAKGDVPVQFATQGIGGPSAGHVMFSLATHTQVVISDLRQGRHIAGQEPQSKMATAGDILVDWQESRRSR